MDVKKIFTGISLSFLCLFLWNASANADGIMVPEPVIRIAPRPIPFAVKYHHVKVSIDHQTARTVIDQVFRNPNNYDLEATYLFPIPEKAAISEFTLWMNGRKIQGEVFEADRARSIYEDIVRRLRDPALLEYADRNLFRARVYPIPGRGEVKIEIAYQETLTYDSGMISYRYPLNTEKFSSSNLEDVSISVDIRSDAPIKSLYSPSHDIFTTISGHTASSSWEAADVKPDRDFLLYYTVSEKDMGLSLVTHRIREDDGYFMLLLSPGEPDEDTMILDKNVIFVLDTSGSMSGEKIIQARKALEFYINSLNKKDRFNIITFATGIEVFDDGLIDADATNIERARGFINRIKARGGTDINGALNEALSISSHRNPLMVVFLTDGQATVGERDTERILSNIRKKNGGNIRVFSFGVGYDVNTHLLDRLSMENGGTVEYLHPGEDIEVKVSNFFSKVGSPILSNLSLKFDGADTADLYPARLPDLFVGTQVVAFGRYRDGGNVLVRLSGDTGDSTREYVFEGRFDNLNEGNDFIPRLWATRKIAYLMTEIRLHGENRELVEEIIRLSREHGIITPYTSYLIVEEGSEEDRRRIMPLTRSMAPAMESARIGMKSEAGRDAFSFSKDIGHLREAEVLEKPDQEAVRYSGRKSFLSSPEGWVEAGRHDDRDVIEIKYLSEKYFKLLREYPEVGKYLSLGSRVTFNFKGKTYRIIE